MNNNSLINNIYINILYVENSFFLLKAMVSRNFLKNLVAKNLIEFPTPHPTKYTSLVLIKQMHLAAEQLCLVFW